MMLKLWNQYLTNIQLNKQYDFFKKLVRLIYYWILQHDLWHRNTQIMTVIWEILKNIIVIQCKFK